MELYLDVEKTTLDLEVEWKSTNPVKTAEPLAKYLQKVYEILLNKRMRLMF